MYVKLAYLSHIAVYLHDAVPRSRNRDVSGNITRYILGGSQGRASLYVIFNV